MDVFAFGFCHTVNRRFSSGDGDVYTIKRKLDPTDCKWVLGRARVFPRVSIRRSTLVWQLGRLLGLTMLFSDCLRH